MTGPLSPIRSGDLRTLCEPKDLGYSCDFSKNSPNPRFWYNTLDSISRTSSIESPIGLWNYITLLSPTCLYIAHSCHNEARNQPGETHDTSTVVTVVICMCKILTFL